MHLQLNLLLSHPVFKDAWGQRNRGFWSTGSTSCYISSCLSFQYCSIFIYKLDLRNKQTNKTPPTWMWKPPDTCMHRAKFGAWHTELLHAVCQWWRADGGSGPRALPGELEVRLRRPWAQEALHTSRAWSMRAAAQRIICDLGKGRASGLFSSLIILAVAVVMGAKLY